MVIALVYWVQIARVVYTETTCARPSATSSRLSARSGAGHRSASSCATYLPHLTCPRLSSGARCGISTTVLLEATLSYLGVGVQPPDAQSWGNIIFENQTYFQSAPWLVFIPGAAILASGARVQPGGRRPCATCSTRPSGGATDGRSTCVRRLIQSAAHPARRQLHHLLPALRPARRSRAPDRRALGHARDGREHPPSSLASISPSSSSTARYLGATSCRATWAAATCRRPKWPN